MSESGVCINCMFIIHLLLITEIYHKRSSDNDAQIWGWHRLLDFSKLYTQNITKNK